MASSSISGLGANLGRQQSLRRTPSDLSKDLAERALPDPEIISRAEGNVEGNKKREQVENQLAGLDGDEPEALVMTHRRRQSEKAQDAMAKALATLEFGEPERVTGANARADGAATPIPPRRTEGLLSPSLENGEFQFPAQAPAAAEGDASKAVEQVVTPWDVQGATVDGVQVSGGSAEKAKKD